MGAASKPLVSRRVKVAGLGKYLPERVIASAALEAELGLEPGWVERVTGVRERRRKGPDETQASMGAQAVLAALADAGCSLDDVDLIVCGSGLSQQAIPCTAVLLQQALGLAARGVPCFDVNSTCLSFVHALDVVGDLVARGSYRCAVVVSTEATSVGLNWSEHESAVLFGDGAAAAVLVPTPEGEPSLLFEGCFTTDSRGAALAEVKGCGTAWPPSDPATPREYALFHMQGTRIFRHAMKQSVGFFTEYSTRLPFALEAFAALCPHQASLVAMRLTARACGFRQDQLVENIETHGNCVSASIPMVLHDGVRGGRIRRGDRVLLAGTAAGLSVGALAMVY
ncbi:MAG: hypothetical protein JNK72_15090 [Myxococcales bacterium]|nr:hypothetical protein [Myxococcales bacterium]